MTILWVRELLRRIAFLFQRKQFDRDLAEEMQFHVDRLAEFERAARLCGSSGIRRS